MALGLNKPDGDAGKTWPAIAIGFFVAFGGVLYGYVGEDSTLAHTLPVLTVTS